jgi:hypothetical protein
MRLARHVTSITESRNDTEFKMKNLKGRGQCVDGSNNKSIQMGVKQIK